MSPRFFHFCHILSLSYRCVWHAIVVSIIIAHIANAVMVCVFLSRIGYPHAIVLYPETNKTRYISFLLIIFIGKLYCTNLFTPRVIACQIDVRPSIQIQVWPAYFAVSSPAHDTLKYIWWLLLFYYYTIITIYYYLLVLAYYYPYY